MSEVTIRYGRLGQNADVRFTTAGKAVCELSVADNHRRKGSSGEWEDDGTTWYRVTLWEQDAEDAATLRKGDRVVVTGELRSRVFEKRDGTQGVSLEVSRAVVGKRPTGEQQTTGERPARGVPVDDPWAVDRAARDDDAPPFS